MNSPNQVIQPKNYTVPVVSVSSTARYHTPTYTKYFFYVSRVVSKRNTWI